MILVQSIIFHINGYYHTYCLYCDVYLRVFFDDMGYFPRQASDQENQKCRYLWAGCATLHACLLLLCFMDDWNHIKSDLPVK